MHYEVIVGTLLGDACMPLDRGKARAARWKPRFCVKFAASADYIQHLYSVFYNPVGRLCWYTSASTEYSWRWRAGSTMYVVSNLWSPWFQILLWPQPMPPKAAAGKKELLKIDIKACKSVSILVHGLRRRRLPETKNAIMFLISHILFSRIHQDLYKL